MNATIVTFESGIEDAQEFIGPPTAAAIRENSGETNHVESHTASRTLKSDIVGLVAKFGSLSSVIRFVGVAAVALSMCLFLLDGMSAVNDSQRFFSMLMLTGVLSAGGFALAFLLKEERGARSFFGLSLLSVPVNFTVLGALLYSVFQFDNTSTAYPTMAHWEILDVASLGSVVLIAAVTLIPITILGISVMAKEGRSWLTGALLVSSSSLLLPVRDTTWIAPLVAIIVIALITAVKYFGENAVALKTVSGRTVQTLLFLPPAIILFRSFWLYDVSALSVLVVTLTVFVALRYASRRINQVGIVASALHVLSAVVALMCALVSLEVLIPSIGTDFIALVFCIVFGSLMLDLESRVQHPRLLYIIGVASAVAIAGATLLHQLHYDGIVVLMTGLLVSITLMSVGIVQKHRAKLLIGGLVFIAILLLSAGGIVAFFTETGWLGFASLGAIAILVASVLERFGPALSLKTRRWFVSS